MEQGVCNRLACSTHLQDGEDRQDSSDDGSLFVDETGEEDDDDIPYKPRELPDRSKMSQQEIQELEHVQERRNSIGHDVYGFFQPLQLKLKV